MFVLARILLFLLLMQSLHIHAAGVTLIHHPENKIHQRFVDAFSRELAARSPKIELNLSSILSALPMSSLTKVIVTVGLDAAQLPLSKSQPAIHTLLTAQNYKTLTQHSDHHSALFVEQPTKRLINLLQIALPQFNDVGILQGSELPQSSAKLQQQFSGAGIQLKIEQISTQQNTLFPALKRLISRSEALLLLPDASIINRSHIKTIIMTSYRSRIPLVGYSKALVKAGAIIGVYSSPEQQGRQAAIMTNTLLTTSNLPPPQYPSQFNIGINYQMARRLNINIATEDEISARLKQKEHQP
jgi:putative tryptophan/tyrosine transport system substrate-binding protein